MEEKIKESSEEKTEQKESLKVNDKVEQRKQKLKNWLSNKYNLYFLGILIFAFIIRIYFFLKVGNQPMWWDEAEYMSQAQNWAFGQRFPFYAVRPILFSFISSIFLRISNSEFLPRLFLFILSLASVVGAYYLGKEMYNKRVGLIASLLMSISYLILFFTYRLLVDIPSLTFFIFSAILFYKYIKTQSKKFLYLTAIIIGIGTLFKLPTAAFLFAAFLFLLFTEKLSFLKKKESWIALIIFFLVLSPYLIWGYFQFGGLVIIEAGKYNAPEGSYLVNGLTNLKGYLYLFPAYFSWPVLIFFILGFLSLCKIFLGFDILMQGRDLKLKRDLYLFLIFLIPFLIVCFFLQHIEDRYIFTIFPIAFIISGAFILRVSDIIKKKSKLFASIFIIALLVVVVYLQFQSANSLIENKQTSYIQVKQAGEWLKLNSDKDALIATRSRPQINYYSERKVMPLDNDFSEFEKQFQELKPDFFMVSIFEKHPDWVQSFIEENQERLQPVQAYTIENQPILIIYKILY